MPKNFTPNRQRVHRLEIRISFLLLVNGVNDKMPTIYGRYMAGFHRKIGHCSVLAAELRVLRDGLQLCIDWNILCVEVEVD